MIHLKGAPQTTTMGEIFQYILTNLLDGTSVLKKLIPTQPIYPQCTQTYKQSYQCFFSRVKLAAIIRGDVIYHMSIYVLLYPSREMQGTSDQRCAKHQRYNPPAHKTLPTTHQTQFHKCYYALEVHHTTRMDTHRTDRFFSHDCENIPSMARTCRHKNDETSLQLLARLQFVNHVETFDERKL